MDQKKRSVAEIRYEFHKKRCAADKWCIVGKRNVKVAYIVTQNVVNDFPLYEH